MRVSAAVLLALALLAPLAAGTGTSDPDPRSVVGPRATEDSVDWHPWFGSGAVVRDFRIDRGLDRILLATSSTELTTSNLIVMDTAGNILANVTLDVDPALRLTLTIDPTSGYTFASRIGSIVLKIDTRTGEVLDRWTLSSPVSATAAHGGRVYASTEDGSIQVLDQYTGAVVGSVSATEPALSLAVDPGGSWLLAGYGRSLNTYSLPSLAPGGMFNVGGASFAPSADGRVWVCGATGSLFEVTGATLHTFWPETGSLEVHTHCHVRVDENPATGVLADAGGWFIRSGETVGRALFMGTRLFAGHGWRADGRALVGVLRVGTGFEVGSWDGTPRLSHPPAAKTVLNPDRFPFFCLFVQTVAGLNATTALAYLDGGATPVPMDLSASFDCVRFEDLADGPHALRVVGWDLLGQRLDDSLAFETDRTPPQIEVDAFVPSGDGPVRLRGWANDSHLESVLVNGQPADLVGTMWSAPMGLSFGGRRFHVRAVDVVGNWAETSFDVRYWPPFERFTGNATGHVSVPIPPGWTVGPAAVPEDWDGVILVGPTEAPAPVSVTVISQRDPRARSDSSYVWDRANDSLRTILGTGGVVVQDVTVFRVHDHTAARLVARVPFPGIEYWYVWTFIALPEWEALVTVTALIPEAILLGHSEDVTWILEGMDIEAAPSTPPVPTDLSIPWLGAGIAAIAVAFVGLVLLVRSRRSKERARRRRQAGP